MRYVIRMLRVTGVTLHTKWKRKREKNNGKQELIIEFLLLQFKVQPWYIGKTFLNKVIDAKVIDAILNIERENISKKRPSVSVVCDMFYYIISTARN